MLYFQVFNEGPDGDQASDELYESRHFAFGDDEDTDNVPNEATMSANDNENNDEDQTEFFVDKGYVFKDIGNLSTSNLTHAETWINDSGSMLISPDSRDKILQADDEGMIGFVDVSDLPDPVSLQMNHGEF